MVNEASARAPFRDSESHRLKRRLLGGLTAAALGVSAACTPTEHDVDWGVVEGDGTICGVFSRPELREVLPEARYTRTGRDVRPAEGERPVDGYCRLDASETSRTLHVVVEPPAGSPLPERYAEAAWGQETFLHEGHEGRYGYRSPNGRDHGWALVESEEYVAAVFLDDLGDADGADLARDLLVQVLDAVDRR